MQRYQLILVAIAALAGSTYHMFQRRAVAVAAETDIHAEAQTQRSLRINQSFIDPKTITPRISKNTVTIYLMKERRDLKFPDDNFNEAFSIFFTDILQRYGTGTVQYLIRDKADCDQTCTIEDMQQQQQGNENGDIGVSSLLQHEPCLAVSRHSKKMLCDIDKLKCNYPRCKTMVTNDEFCTKIDLPFDSRQYYTADLPHLGYIPIGPRIDSWQSFQKIIQQSKPGFFIAPSSRRKFAFNAIFSRSTNSDRKKLAVEIEQHQQQSKKKRGGIKFPVFTAMAEQWQRHDAEDATTDQLNTDEYMAVLLDSVFTISPAGHSPECFRLFEAVEAGSIPIMTHDDLHGAHHPDADKGKKFRNAPHPCKDSLHHWYDAPMVVLESWEDLYPTVEKLLLDPRALDEMQDNMRRWFDSYMRRVVAEFESFVLSPTANNDVA